jgi:hypothetical protein
METYHKIQTLFKRITSGPDKGRMIEGAWTTPELEYLAGNQWEYTEKVDGTNIRVIYDPYVHPDDQVRFLGRSDGAIIPAPLLAHLKETFQGYPYDVFDSRVTLFGEGYGPKIQGGGKYRNDHSFVLFDVKIGDFWLRRHDVDDIAAKLSIDSVPVIGHGTLYQAINLVKYGTAYHDKEVEAVRSVMTNDWLSQVPGMTSRWGNFEAEGIVARPAVPMFDRQGGRIITKVKGVDFR